MNEEQKMSAEDIKKSVGGKTVGEDEWEKGEEIKSGWVNLEVGESIKGTLINRRIQKSTIQGYPDQWVYELKVDNGISMIGFSVDKTFINNKLKNLQVGQIVMIKRFEDFPSTKFKGKFAKSFNARLFGMDENYVEPEQGDTQEEINVDSVSFN